MIRKYNIYSWLSMLAILPMLLTACLEDDEYQCPTQSDKIQLTLLLPEQTRIATNTRATSSRVDYSTVNTLNIVLASKDNEIIKAYYFDENGASENDKNVTMSANTLPMTSEDNNNKRSIRIVGEEGEFDNVQTIYAIANHNGKIDTKSIRTVAALKNLKQTTTDGQPNKAANCMMFGSTSQLSNGSISLERTLAMFSVKIDGSGLKKGVRITPKKISLHNVPTSCLIGNDNKINNSNESVAIGQTVDLANAEGWGALTNENRYIGGHELENGTIPLFMFENLQGINENITGIDKQINKHPKEYAGKTPAELQSFLDKEKKYTYILIEADYYYQNPNNSNDGVHGSIAYRFLLGDNEYNDFNIERNNYYQITLSLKGNGGAQEDGKEDKDGNLVVNSNDLSWRVEMDVEDWGFVKDKFDFDSHATHGYLEVVGEGWTIGGSSASWIKFYSPDKEEWVEPTKYGTCGENGKIEFIIQPWSWYADGFNNVKNDKSREIVLEISKNGKTQKVTIKQWTPIYIKNNVWVERFEENEEELSWGYMNDDMNGSAYVTEDSGFTGSKNFSYGTSTTFQGMQNTWYMYYKKQNESPVQVYCYQKGGFDLNKYSKKPNLNNDYYCLPDADTMKEIMEYKYKGSNPFQPLRTDKEYWTGSVYDQNKKETYYCSIDPSNGKTILKTTAQRNAKKRARAIYRANPFN